MVSAEKYITRTAVRWLLIGDGMRVIELANAEKNKKWPYQINQRENGYSVLYSTVQYVLLS